MNIVIRQATKDDTGVVQVLRKIGWQDNYVFEEGGVTRELLVNELAKLPVPQSDIEYYDRVLDRQENKDLNLVAEVDGKVVGVVMCELNGEGRGDIGVFVDRDYQGQGIGSMLLEALVAKTPYDLEVTIFALNKSRALYKKFGFVEDGQEAKHFFKEIVYLPTQRLIYRKS